MSDCCSPKANANATWFQQVDWLFWSTFSLILMAVVAHLVAPQAMQDLPALGNQASQFAQSATYFMQEMWWSLILAVLVVSAMNFIPTDLYTRVLGNGRSLSGIFRAMLAGVLLDLCSHGILMVGAKLYKQGASLGQLYAFLITSPWNSISMMLVLAALVGWVWVGVYLVLSAVVGVLTGLLVEWAVGMGWLPSNPRSLSQHSDASEGMQPTYNLRKLSDWGKAVIEGAQESQMVLRWVFLGVVLAAALQTLVPTETFSAWFGPTLAGLGLTLVGATILEVCSEGSIPIAADLLTRAGAPGNAFVFLMAGASTDYTEIMVLRDTTGRWKTALALPLLTVPQVLLLGWILNQFA